MSKTKHTRFFYWVTGILCYTVHPIEAPIQLAKAIDLVAPVIEPNKNGKI